MGSLFVFININLKEDVYTIYTEKCEFYAKTELFLKNIYWLLYNVWIAWIYNSVSLKEYKINIHNWRKKMSTHVTSTNLKRYPSSVNMKSTYLRDAVKVTHHAIHEKTWSWERFLGWVDLRFNMTKRRICSHSKCAEKKLKMNSDILLVVGIAVVLTFRSTCSNRNVTHSFHTF